MVSWTCDCVPSYIPTYMACPLVPRIAPNKKQFTLVRSDEMSVLYLEPLKYRKPDRKLISNWATLALFDMDLMEAVDLKSSKLFSPPSNSIGSLYPNNFEYLVFFVSWLHLPIQQDLLAPVFHKGHERVRNVGHSCKYPRLVRAASGYAIQLSDLCLICFSLWIIHFKSM